MTAPAFELIDKSTFRVGDKVLSGHFCDPPLDGRYRYVTDGTSDERDRICQHLFVHDFRDVRPSDLPNGISINIQNPKSEFRQVNLVEIRKVEDQSELAIVLSFDYADWHLPLNLQYFAERYRDALLQQVDNARSCDVDQSDVGLFINCSIVVTPDINYLSAYRKADVQVLAAYRKCLADIYRQQHSTKEETAPAQVEDSVGAKWWFRYVIVPVIGSGTVAAIAAGLVALLK